jgi:hypothetical protein
MNRKCFIISFLVIGCFIATSMLTPRVGTAQVDKVKASMAALIAQTGKLGAPKIEGTDPVPGRDDAPALYFGATKMNNSSEVVDEVVKEHDGVATLFVKLIRAPGAPARYVRVSTTVKRPDGSSAIGSSLDPASPALGSINRGEAFYGYANIEGKVYDTGYEPIRDASGNVIGIYAVGYAAE